MSKNDCLLDPLLVMALVVGGKVPCEGCNMTECRRHPGRGMVKEEKTKGDK